MNLLRLLAVIALGILTSACVTRRTVTQGGRTVEEKYVIKRPIKSVIQSIEVE